MELVPHPSWIEIDLAQFKRNLAAIRKMLQGTLYCLPVKANAYGHGLFEIAKAAVEEKIDYLGVSCLKEGMLLRKEGFSIPILVFGAFQEEQVFDLLEHNLEFSISSRFKAELVLKKCQELKKSSSVHLEVDTGMQRTGVRPSSLPELFRFLESSSYFQIKGIYSHLATADRQSDPFAKKQIELFKELKEALGKRDCLYHLANSGGVAYYPDSYFDMARPGLLSYGYFPGGENDLEIAPCFSLKSKISYFKVVEKGIGISYGHRYQTKERTRIITIPIGYGDGYFRAFSNRAPILVRGKRYTVSGAVCMDQFMVDIGEGEGYVGDVATLIGKEGKEEITLWELARLAESIPYEILTMLNDRLPRRITRRLKKDQCESEAAHISVQSSIKIPLKSRT